MVLMSPALRPKGRSVNGGPSGADEACARHVAIIMDGNGRWAKHRALPRSFGHRAGVNALKRTVEGAAELGLGLLKNYVRSDLARLEAEGARIRIIGRRSDLARDVLEVIEHAESRTRHNTRFQLQVAFNYGGRADIAEAAARYAKALASGALTSGEMSEETFGRFLSTAEGPPVDLVIRTSGERRLSNFLLWEAAYAELVFQDVLWPDYGPEHLRSALKEFRNRERRYGGAEVDDVLAAS
jgi:undecaprenyl diphosphate synthase